MLVKVAYYASNIAWFFQIMLVMLIFKSYATSSQSMISEKETQSKSKLYIHCLQSMTPFYLEL